MESNNVQLSDNETDFSCDSGELYEPPENDENVAAEVEVGAEEIDNNNGSSIEQSEESRPRKRKGESDSSEWKRQKNAKLRVKGKSYLGFKKNEHGKYEQVHMKGAKTVRPRCEGHSTARLSKGGPRQNFECSTISDEDRASIFDYFWNLSTWEAKKCLLQGVSFRAVQNIDEKIVTLKFQGKK